MLFIARKGVYVYAYLYINVSNSESIIIDLAAGGHVVHVIYPPICYSEFPWKSLYEICTLIQCGNARQCGNLLQAPPPDFQET
jgi:hypothetical protein